MFHGTLKGQIMVNTEKLQESLLKLSEVLPLGGASPYKTTFDEFMREHEFGLALHSVCDYLIADGVESITPSRIMLIQELHSAMAVDDDCISELESARSQASRMPRS